MHLIWTTVKFCTVSLFQIKKIKKTHRPHYCLYTKQSLQKWWAPHFQVFVKRFNFIFQVDSIFKIIFTWAFEELLVHQPVDTKKQTWDVVYYQRTVLIYIYYSGIGLIIDSAVLCRMVYSQRAWIWVVGHGPSWPHRSGSSPPYCGWRSWHSSAASRRAWAERRLQSEETRGEAVQLEQEVVHV